MSFLLTLVPFLKRWGIKLLLVVAIFTSGWVVNGWRLNNQITQIHLEQATALQKANAEIRKMEIDQQQAADEANKKIQKLLQKNEQAKKHTQEVVRKYEKDHADNDFIVPLDWVRAYNSINSEESSSPTKPSVDAPSGTHKESPGETNDGE